MFSTKNLFRAMGALAVTIALLACGGGGGGGGYSGGSGGILYYPYETVYGDVCATFEATPSCTFDRSTGLRINVTHDPYYDSYGNGSDDLDYVVFDSSGTGAVYSASGLFLGYRDVSQFANYVGSTYIGVGTTGLFWEDIRNGTYWWGKNGVLYSANLLDSNYGDAINDDTADSATDTNFSAIVSDSNKKLVKRAADKLVKDYSFKQDKAMAVASALNAWAIAGVERGKSTTSDINKTFKTVFGVNYSDALAAVKDLAMGDNGAMKELSNRSAAALGLKPNQAQKFMKGMYKKALAEWGYGDIESYNW